MKTFLALVRLVVIRLLLFQIMTNKNGAEFQLRNRPVGEPGNPGWTGNLVRPTVPSSSSNWRPSLRQVLPLYSDLRILLGNNWNVEFESLLEMNNPYQPTLQTR